MEDPFVTAMRQSAIECYRAGVSPETIRQDAKEFAGEAGGYFMLGVADVVEAMVEKAKSD